MGELRGVLNEPNHLERIKALATLVGTFGEGDVPEVAQVLDRGAIGLGGVETDVLVRWWASYQPYEAGIWAFNDSPDGYRAVAIDAALETAALYDLAMAYAVLEDIPDARRIDGDIGRVALIRGWYLSGEPGVEDYLRSLGHDVPQQVGLRSLAQTIVLTEGPEGLAKWLDELEDRGHMFKTSAYRKATPAMLRADLEYTLKWCEEVCEDPHADLVRQIISKEWAKEDGPAAMRWVSTTPAGKTRDRAVQTTFMGWRSQDDEGLMQWITEMGPDGVEPWFEPAVGRVAMWLAWDYPLESYKWASKIEKDSDRELAFISISRRFREADEAAAEAWLEQSDLSEEARAKARTFPPRWKGRGERPYPPPSPYPPGSKG
jgi:hypothetical protein